jgi:hypothetical protein
MQIDVQIKSVCTDTEFKITKDLSIRKQFKKCYTSCKKSYVYYVIKSLKRYLCIRIV